MQNFYNDTSEAFTQLQQAFSQRQRPIDGDMQAAVEAIEAVIDAGDFDTDQIVLNDLISQLSASRTAVFLLETQFATIKDILARHPSRLNYFTNALAQMSLPLRNLHNLLLRTEEPLLMAAILDYQIKFQCDVSKLLIQGKPAFTWAVEQGFVTVAARFFLYPNPEASFDPYAAPAPAKSGISSSDPVGANRGASMSVSAIASSDPVVSIAARGGASSVSRGRAGHATFSTGFAKSTASTSRSSASSTPPPSRPGNGK